MEPIPQAFLSMPLYIPLPRHPVTREKRYALVHVNLEHVGWTIVRPKTQWTVVQALGPFQGDVGHAAYTPPSIPGVTVFMPPNPMANPVYVFVNHVDGKRIRPGLLVTVTVRHEPSVDHDGIVVDVVVKANTGSRTVYSDEVGIGCMLRDDNVDEDYSRTATLEEARTAYLEEMRWRGESLGPPESPVKSEEERVRNQSCDRGTCRRHKTRVDVDAVRGTEGCQAPSQDAGEGGETADLATRVGCGDADEETGPCVVDEHSIDDCYA